MHTKKQSPARGLAVLAIVSVLVLGMGTAVRMVGLQKMQTRLIDEYGDHQALQPFQLSAYSRFQAENAITFVALENGQLSGQVFPEQVRLPENASLPDDFDDLNIITIAPEERDAVNQKASYSGNTATSSAQSLWVMRLITLPDNTSLRLHIADYQADEPVEVMSYPAAWSGMDWDVFGDYGRQAYPQWTSNLYVRWGDSWMVGLNKDSILYQPGIWRVTESLSEEEVQTLPTDGKVQYGDISVDVLNKSTEYGSVELFYVPQNLEEILKCVTLDQYLGVLYQDTDGNIRFDLVDENASCLQQELIFQDVGTEYSCTQVNTQQADQSCFVLGLHQGTDYRIVSLQIDQSGKLEWIDLPGNLLNDGSLLPGTTVIQRSDDGRYLLFVGREENQIQVDRAFQQVDSLSYPIGYRLNVYDLNEKDVVYSGLLDTGAAKVWGSYVRNPSFMFYGLAGELLSLNRDYYTVFPQEAQGGTTND